MKTKWDYTELAEAYLKRPEYSQEAIDEMLLYSHVSLESRICDVGAGAAHLTIMMARKGYSVQAIEPNDAMRKNGINRTQSLKVKWSEGIGEDTRMKSDFFDLVTFGSSFNVCDRKKALIETHRILKPKGYFACMWNHRNLDDPIQDEIENIIKRNIPDYDYGERREDQTSIIEASGLFKKVHKIEGVVHHKLNVNDFIEGWKSHGTVHRQSKEIFLNIINEIRAYVLSLEVESIIVPYTTRIWIAEVKK